MGHVSGLGLTQAALKTAEREAAFKTHLVLDLNSF